jgi:hypothetical protein
MKKLIFFVVLFLSTVASPCQKDTIDFSVPPDFTQIIIPHRRIPDNSFFLDIAGYLNLVSLNYERIFFHRHDFYLSGRAGLGYTPPSVNMISIPAMLNGIFRVSDTFFFEVGAGFCLTYSFWQDYYSNGGLMSDTNFYKKGGLIDPLLAGYAGIRVQKKKGFLFRFGFTPLYELTNYVEQRAVYKQTGTTNAFLPWFGMSFGYSF